MPNGDLPADMESIEFKNTVRQLLSDIPEDRCTPLDIFVAEALLKRNIITGVQLLECIEECKFSSESISLFKTIRSHGYLDESHVDMLLRLYRRQIQDKDSAVTDVTYTLGDIAIKKRLASRSDIWSAIEQQEKQRAAGIEQRLGEILIDRGTLSIVDVKNILETQGKRVLRCPGCGQQYNIAGYSPSNEYTCLSCGKKLSDTGEVDSLAVSGTVAEEAVQVKETEDEFIGKHISGCRIISKLGQGGMGAVYKAHHMRLNRTVAVKVMSPGLLGDIHRQRFMREARSAASLDHPNIMIVHDVGEFEDSPYIIMQYVDGKSVGELLDAKEKFDQVGAVRVIIGATEALDAAHQRDIIHRDIKPDNIMITQSGQVKVMDFGLAKQTGPEDMGVTASGVILGTPVYMSPEQFSAMELDGRSDIYSLGVTFYHMIAGQAPFTGKTPYELGTKHMQTPPPPLRTYSPGTAPQICAIIEKMLTKDREERYSSATELLTDLKQALAELSGDTITYTAPVKSKKKFKLLIPLLAVAAVIVVVLLFLPRQNLPQAALPNVDEKHASKAYLELKPKVEKHLTEQKYIEALTLLNSFPSKFAGTETWGKVESDKTRMLELIFSYLEQAMANIDKNIADNDLAAALEGSHLLKEQSNKIMSLVSALPRTGKTGELVLQIEKQAVIGRSLKSEIEDYDRLRSNINTLLKDGKNGRAEDILAKSEFQNYELRKHLKKLRTMVGISSVPVDVEAEKERWATAKKTAQLLLDNESFKEAFAVISIGRFEQSRVPEIATKAAALKREITSKHKQHIESDIEMASDLIKKWELISANELLQNHIEEEEYKDRITKLLATINMRLSYLGNEGQAKKLMDSGKAQDAREKLKPWLSYPDTEIAGRASELDLKALKLHHPKMVYFPSGTYTLGNKHSIKLHALLVDKFEVTKKQYDEFLKATKHAPPSGWNANQNPDLPVTGVTYNDAYEYAKWAGKRLPTEEEWEIAASWNSKTGNPLVFPWGDTFDRNKCNINSKNPDPVGFVPGDTSPSGLHDMAGNVCEWTATKKGNKRIVKGGSWADTSPKAFRCDFWFPYDPQTRANRLGFRCVKDVE